MAISDTINSLKEHIGNAYTAIGKKKGTVPTSKNCENLQAAIESIPNGKEEQTKTVTITKNGTERVIPAEGKVLSEVTVITDVPATPTQEKTVDLNMAFGNQVVTSDEGKNLSEVTIKKPATMLPENIAKDVNIGGVVGTLESGGGGELNIHYGDTAPEDTSKLWIKSEEPSNISFPVVWNPEQIVEGVTDTEMIFNRFYAGVATIGTKIYIFGGRNSSGNNFKDITIVDTAHNTVQTLPVTLDRYLSHMGTAVVGTKIYLCGGYSYGSSSGSSNSLYKSIQVFDTTNNTIQTLSVTIDGDYCGVSAAAVGTKIYLFTKESSDAYYGIIQVFDTTNNTIKTLINTTNISGYDMGTATVGLKIYLFGGTRNNTTRYNDIKIFDTTTNDIQYTSSKLKYSMSNMGVATVGTKIYLFGGEYGTYGTRVNDIQMFDITDNTIQTLSTTLPAKKEGIGAAAVGTKIYLCGVSDTINLFTVDVPLSSNDIIVTQEYYSRTFKVMKAPTEVEVACKYVYKGDQNLAKFIDAYLYDGANWVNVNTGDFTFTKLYAPKISISGKTLTITNDSRNGSKVTNYKVYNGSTLLTTITATTLDLTTVITVNGTYNISVIATGTGYTDSDNSNVIEYNYGVYNITTNLTNVTANASNPTTVSTVASSTLTFTANTGYNLPDNVTVTGAEFTWTKSSGTLVLSNPTGNVSVTVAGVAISRTITATLTNVTAASGNATSIATGETKILTYTAADGYALPDTVTVTGATGVWNKDAGTLTLSNPTANVTFTIAGVAAASGYNVTIKPGSESHPFNIYDGQSASGTKLGSLQYNTPPINVVCTSGYIYLDSKSGFQSNTVGVTGGVALQSSGDTNATFIVTGDGTITAEFFCLIEGTQITLADGTTKAIEDITYDDELLVWNFYDGKFDKAKPSWIKVEETAPRYNLVKFSNGSEIGFVGAGGEKGYHRIFNKEAGTFTHTGCKDTPNGTTTFAQNGTFPTVVSQEVVEKSVKYYNVITDKHYNLFANGILTSCKLSNKYRIEDMKYVGEKLISDEQEKAYFERIEDKRK